jgi:hypothetical protein
MTTIINSFHNSSATVRANVGETVSRSTLNRVRRALCGRSDCTCGDTAGARESRYTLVPQGLDQDAPILVTDNRG